MSKKPPSWCFEERRCAEIIKNPNNPRILSEVSALHLKNSLKDFGLCSPLVINRDGTLISGHQRLSLLEEEGIESVQVAVPSRDLTDRELEKLSLLLNRVQGDFDYDILANFYDTELLLESGFDEKELFETPDKKKAKKPSVRLVFQCEHDLRKMQPLLESYLLENSEISMTINL